jgi:hypothetical protein
MTERGQVNSTSGSGRSPASVNRSVLFVLLNQPPLAIEFLFASFLDVFVSTHPFVFGEQLVFVQSNTPFFHYVYPIPGVNFRENQFLVGDESVSMSQIHCLKKLGIARM